MKKSVTIITVLLVIIIALTGCSHNIPDKVFSNDGIKITLNENFSKEELENATLCYKSFSTLIIIEKLEFQELASKEITADSTLDDFADYVIEYLALDEKTEFVKRNNSKYMTAEYTNFVQDGDYTFVPCLFKGPDAFWIVNFCEPMLYAIDDKEEFFRWADSVEFY